MDVLKKVRIEHSIESGSVVLANANERGEDIIACVPSGTCKIIS